MSLERRKRVAVAVILVNYNSAPYTLECVASLQKRTPREGPSYEIVIVDNDSRPEDYEHLQRELAAHDASGSNVRLFRSKLNLGFAGGNMLGVQLVNADFYFFLNNDTQLLNDVVGILFRYMTEHPEVGVATAQMFDENERFTKSFHYFPHIVESVFGVGFARLLMPSRYPTNRKAYDAPVRVPYVTGAAMFCRAEALVAAGGLDVTHFLYWEEQDLCWRVQQKGFGVALVPEARFLHFYGKSTERRYRIAAEEMISMFLFLRKSYPLWHRLLLQLFYAFKHLRKFYKGWDQVRLALFVLRGAPLSHSLRYDQTLTEDPPGLGEQGARKLETNGESQ